MRLRRGTRPSPSPTRTKCCCCPNRSIPPSSSAAVCNRRGEARSIPTIGVSSPQPGSSSKTDSHREGSVAFPAIPVRDGFLPGLQFPRVTAADFRRIALSFDGTEEGSHMGAADFRVGGRIFATLASVKEGFGNLMLTPEIQAEFVVEEPGVFIPVAGGWGRMGITHVRLAKANR